MKSCKNHGFYYVYCTYSHCILASFPSLDHQKHGPRNCFPLWHPKSETNHKKVSKVSPKRPPKCILKSLKMDTWTSRCLLGVPVAPWITKMEHQGHQNNSLGYKKWPISGVIQSSVACWSKGGRRQGRSLKIHIYIYIYTSVNPRIPFSKWKRAEWCEAECNDAETVFWNSFFEQSSWALLS